MGVLTELKPRSEIVTDAQLEINTEEILSQKYQVFIGYKVNKSIFRVKGKHMVNYAKAVGDLNPKYVNVAVVDGKEDFSSIKAHPSFPNCWAIDSAFDMTSWRFLPKGEEEEGRLLIPVPSKILHTSISYDYTNAEIAIQHKQKLYTTGYCDEIFVRSNKLWIQVHLDTKTKDEKLVVQSKVQFLVRQGGFAL